MHEPGTTTRDMLTRGQQHPAETGIDPQARETTMQRWGGRCFTAGITVIVGTYAASLVAAVLTDTQLYSDPEARLFAVIGMIALIMLGTLLLGFGAWERLGRYDRTQARLLLVNQARILDELAAVRQQANDHADQAALTAGAVNRIERVIDTIPNAGQIVAQALRLSQPNHPDRS